VFSDQEIQEIEELKKRYEKPMAILLPILWRLQEKNGWIDDAGMEEAARICEVEKSHVLGVVSFYTMFFDRPMGRYHVQVCTNVSCMLRGGEKLYSEMKATLGIGHKECTPDGLFSLEEVECMGACGGAPMIAVNETFFERVTSSESAEIIGSIRSTGTIPEPKPTIQMPELSEESNG
jgi:NADH-quinone oxidoreductase subunit E